MLPGGRAVLFTITAVTGGLDAAQVARPGPADRDAARSLVRGGSHAHYVPSGHLVYAAAGTLRAVAFDLATWRRAARRCRSFLSGHDTRRRRERRGGGRRHVGLRVGGALQSEARTLVWVDRRGHEEPLKAPARAYVYPRLSPDGTRVAAEVRDQEWDIWILNLVSTTLTRFSFGPGADRLPVWTPDGQRIVWTSGRAGRCQSLLAGGRWFRIGRATHPKSESPVSLRHLARRYAAGGPRGRRDTAT